jgi:hypothetical protein
MQKLGGLGLGLLTLAALLTATPSAFAVESATAPAKQAWDCPDDARGCLWDGRGGTGDVYIVRDCGVYDLPAEWRDRASSLQIIRAYELAVFDYVDGQPEFMQSLLGNGQPPGQGADMSEIPDNDKIADRVEVTCP